MSNKMVRPACFKYTGFKVIATKTEFENQIGKFLN